MTAPTSRSPADFAAALRAGSPGSAANTLSPATDRFKYRQAAALLSAFDPVTLRATKGGDPGGALQALLDDCTVKARGDDPGWTLTPHVRELALASFADAEHALEALEANEDQLLETGAERFALAYLRGCPPALGDLDVAQLARACDAVAWLRVIPGAPSLPDAIELEQVLGRARLLGPLTTLLAHRVEGRKKELAQIRRHIDRPKPSRGRRATSALIGTPDDLPPADMPLVVYGAGGVGKSTLIAKALMDYLAKASAAVPFVYVDFERADVRLPEPFSLIAEMCHQLGVQYPQHAEALGALEAKARDRARTSRARRADLDSVNSIAATRATMGRSGEQQFHAKARKDEARMATEFAAIVSGLGRSDQEQLPFLVVLDSFEAAQYRASPVLDRLWSMFRQLGRGYSHTRVVVGGRAPVGHPHISSDEVPAIELRELDSRAAELVLVGRGVTVPVAHALVRRIGGSPLSLQLAADVAMSMQNGNSGDDWIHTVPAKRRRLFGAVDDMLIQGVLYDRLLKHIPDPAVRRLSHPGLVLRRITPEVIRQVLAPACGVDVPSPERAHELFEEMARGYLVERVKPQVLRHRPDMRRVMLRLLAEDKSAATRDIERRAVEFYAARPDATDRAEELYHRLRLEEDLGQVRQRWLPSAANYLVDAREELPKRSARLLDDLCRLESEPGLGVDEQQDWERQTAEVVEDLLAQGYAADALALMRGHEPWTTCSPLHVLQIEALERADRGKDAQAALDACLTRDDIVPCGDTYLELLLKSADMAAARGDLDSADADLTRAERAATSLGRELDALGVLLRRAQLHPDDTAAGEAADVALVRRIDDMPDPMLESAAALMRAAAAEVGRRQPRILVQALDLVGLPMPTDRTLSRLADKIVIALAEQPVLVEMLARLAHTSTEEWTSPQAAQVHELLGEAQADGNLDNVAKQLLTIHDSSGALVDGVAEAMAETTVDD